MTKRVFIASACRTAIGSFQGMFANTSAVNLGVTAVREALNRAGLEGREIEVDEVNLGCIYQAAQGQGVARQVSIHAGIPNTTPAVTSNILCGSGLFSVVQAVRAIRSGDCHIVVAGGTENMTKAPYLLAKGREGYRMGHAEVYDHMIYDGLTDAFNNYHMGMTAENLAEKYEISREEQDQFAVDSQNKAEKAQDEGRFKDEIVAVTVKKRREEIVCDTDEYIRKGATFEGMQKLRAAFKKDGSVTAGNASGINDGAAALVVVSEEKLTELGVEPLAEIVGWGVSGCEPSIMGIGPVQAVKNALKVSGSSIGQLELIEANEAFAAQSIAVNKELGWDTQKVNVNGGAIALGHPVGASGARILVTLLHEMKRSSQKEGLATLCVGGGMGVALQVRR